MVYETEIKLKEYTILIEFDSNTEEFSYQIKSRRKANEKKGQVEGTGTGKSDSGKSDSGNITGRESESDSDFL